MVGPVVDVLNIEVMPAFAGAWRGRKDYLADGKVVAWADWVFQIRMTGREALQFVNGPPARITGPSTFAFGENLSSPPDFARSCTRRRAARALPGGLPDDSSAFRRAKARR